MGAPRCRFCTCILRSDVTRARGCCKFRACVNQAAREGS
jgi:hypothetical protein